MSMTTMFLAGCGAAVMSAALPGSELETHPLFLFDGAASIEAWSPNHDRIMGGVSTGRPAWTGECARFSGELSLENNGGFASFRRRLVGPLDLSAYDGVLLRVRGDGRNWKVSLRTGQGQDDHNWQASFQTSQSDKWQEVTLPFDGFVPVFHGRYARTKNPLDQAKIVGFGFQVADGQAGDYRLDVASIHGWSADTEEAPPGTIGARELRSTFLAKTLEQTASAEALVETMRWSERVLVVAEPLQGGDYGKSASIQRGRLASELKELAARDLRVVHLLGDRAALAAGEQLGSKTTQALRERWDLPTGQWSCALVGKDGVVKKRWSEPFDPLRAFEVIDAMPMRRSEARRRGAHH